MAHDADKSVQIRKKQHWPCSDTGRVPANKNLGMANDAWIFQVG